MLYNSSCFTLDALCPSEASQPASHQYKVTGQKCAAVRNSLVVHRLHFVNDFCTRVHLENLHSTDTLTTVFSFTTEDDMNIHSNFDAAGTDKVRMEIGPVFPVEGKLSPGKLGQQGFAMELAADNSEGVFTHQACVLVRVESKRKTLNSVFHCQQVVSRLLDADIIALGTKPVTSK